MESDDVKIRYVLLGQTVDRSFGDENGNRRFNRFHGRGLKRARKETSELVAAQKLLLLDRIQHSTRRYMPRKKRDIKTARPHGACAERHRRKSLLPASLRDLPPKIPIREPYSADDWIESEKVTTMTF